MRVNLTPRTIQSYAKSTKRKLIRDAEAPLYVEVRPTGQGKALVTWQARFRNAAGKQRVLRLGAFPDMGLADARKAARTAIGAVADGEDPADAKAMERAQRRRKAARTFGTVAREYLKDCEGNGRRTRTLDLYRQVLGIEPEKPSKDDRGRRPGYRAVTLIGDLGDQPIADLDRGDFRAFRDAFVEAVQAQGRGEGHLGANGALRIARAVMHYAAREGDLAAVPSFNGLFFDKGGRTRRWTHAELRAIWLASEKLGNPWGQYVRLLILTGARRTEMARARWEHWDGNVLRFPAETTKGGRWHTIPLPQTARENLDALPQSGAFIFSTDGGKRPIGGFSKLKAAIEAELAEPIVDWRMHDCRHNLSSFLADRGWPESERAALLNHAQATVTAVYTHSDALTSKLRALAEWEMHVLQVLGRAADAGNVVTIHGRSHD